MYESVIIFQYARVRPSGFIQVDEFSDLNTATEIELGRLVKQRYDGADFFIMDGYPSTIRPFYTMPSPHDNRFSNSYDLFLRGQEICSGAQRCHDSVKKTMSVLYLYKSV